ncbi:MAG: hypothetical protein EXR58_07530 [Chloroflexi bacterium]|nr:hypothetical protein [Chloroflexota bacterium]
MKGFTGILAAIGATIWIAQSYHAQPLLPGAKPPTGEALGILGGWVLAALVLWAILYFAFSFVVN